MKRILLILLAVIPLHNAAQRLQQAMDRSVVAVHRGTNVTVTWRKLIQDPDSCTYNLFIRNVGGSDYTKVNASPLKGTNLVSNLSVIPYNSELSVSTVNKDGTENVKSAPFLFKQQTYNNAFVDINFETKVLTPDKYRASYVWPADLNGDGLMNEYVVDRKYRDSIATDNKNSMLQAYSADGTCLWTVDMGPNVNIDTGQNDMVEVYDINCDGKAEVMVKSSDGTRFWNSSTKDWGTYVFGKTIPDIDNDGITDYTVSGLKRNPPFYISVINGMTGEEMVSSELDYSQVHDGADQYTRDNRADYMGDDYYTMGGHFAICYFDGIHPSLVMECLDRTQSDQIHHNYVFAFGYDWDGNTPSNFHHYYTWSRNDKTPWPAEFHQLRVCDVDGNGIDEMLQGGYGVNAKEGMVFSAGIGHGDRFRVSDIDPNRPGLETYAIQQSDLLGQLLYESATGKHIKEWYLPSVTDVGRGECMDVDPSHKGYEIYSTMANLYDCEGNVVKSYDAGAGAFPYEGIWWDGDLGRETLASNGGSGYATNMLVSNYDEVKSYNRMIEFSKESSWDIHGTNGARPGFIGDMTGDWREEVILFKQDASSSTGFVGYSTDIATDYNLYCLQQDAHYRLDCTTRGYYQSPNTDFYLGYDMPAPPLPPSVVTDLRWKKGANISKSSSGFTSFDMGSDENFADGKSLMFDISGDNSQTINISDELKPSSVYLMTPKNHDYAFTISGKLSGTMNLYKSMQGTATINGNLDYTGSTVISEGTLDVNGSIAGRVRLMAKGSLSGNAVVNDIAFEGGLNYEGCRLMPGDDTNYGKITISRSVTMPGNVYTQLKVNVTTGQQDFLTVQGDLVYKGNNTFTIVNKGSSMTQGSYILAQCTGSMTVNTDSITIRGLVGIPYTVKADGNKLLLVVNETRKASDYVRWIGNVSTLWDFHTNNFVLGTTATPFVSGDIITFGDEAKQRNILLNEQIIAKSVIFDFDQGNYNLSGTGLISDSTVLYKRGKGELTLDLAKNNYFGKTVIEDGILTVNTLSNAGSASDIGAATDAASNFTIAKGTLKTLALNMATDHEILLTDSATINVGNEKGALSLTGQLTGQGYLIKDGPGQLNLTYAGENTYSGTILRAGTIAQGNWQTTFGKSGSVMRMQGGKLLLVANKGMTTIPVYDYVTVVDSATESTIIGSFRSKIGGSFSGQGSLVIQSGGDRCDVQSDFTGFRGTLHATGENFRLVPATSDMPNTTLVIASGTKVGHYKAQSATALTTQIRKIGALASSASDAELTNGYYEIGYNNTDTLFAGKLTAQKVSKYGTGSWTITGTESTSPLYVEEGTLYSKNAKTTGTVTVDKSAVFAGTISCGNVTLDHAVLRPELSGSVSTGYEYKMFNTSGTITGTYTVDGNGYVWNDDELLSRGVLKMISTDIHNISADINVNVYTVSGILLRSNVAKDKALDNLPAGIYIVNGKNVIKK